MSCKFINNFISFTIKMSSWAQINLLDPINHLQMELKLFHDHGIILRVGIIVLVLIVSTRLIFNRLHTRTVHEAQTLEILWTLFPAVLLIWLALPSLRLLYLIDEQANSNIVVKALGHQWYWRYELPTVGASFDSYIVPENTLKFGEYRLLEVDKRVLLPYNISSSIITTSSDVIHSWTVPSLGIKIDAVPGRLNIVVTKPSFPGVLYGQCSEICGANHAFIPIVLETVKANDLYN